MLVRIIVPCLERPVNDYCDDYVTPHLILTVTAVGTCHDRALT